MVKEEIEKLRSETLVQFERMNTMIVTNQASAAITEEKPAGETSEG